MHARSAHSHQVTAYISNGGDRFVAPDGTGGDSSLTTSTAGSSQAHPILPPTLVVNYVIKF